MHKNIKQNSYDKIYPGHSLFFISTFDALKLLADRLLVFKQRRIFKIIYKTPEQRSDESAVAQTIANLHKAELLYNLAMLAIFSF